MPIARIQLPDGRIARVEVPEGTTPQQAEAFARSVAAKQPATKPAAKPAPRPSAAQTAADSAKAVGGAAWRGLFGGIEFFADPLADVGDAVTGGVANVLASGLSAVGADRAAEFIAPDKPRPRVRPSDLPDRLGTPRPVSAGTELGANVLGGAMIPLPGAKAPVRPQAPRPNVVKQTGQAARAQKYAAGQKFGLDLSRGDVGGMGAKMVECTLDVQPGAASVMNASRQKLAGQIDEAVDTVAGTFGPKTSFRSMGEAVQAGVRGWKTRFNEVAGRLYDNIPIKPNSQASVTATVAELDNLTTKITSNPKLAAMLTDKRLVGYLDALKGTQKQVATGLLDEAGNPITRTVVEGGRLSWNDLKQLRSRIGEEIGEQMFGEGTLKSDLRALYAALSRDMEATAKLQGPAAYNAFRRANNVYKAGMDKLDRVWVDILGKDGAKSAEAAAAFMQRITKEGKGSADIARLAEIKGTLKPDEWGQVSNSVVHLLGQPANSAGREFNPGTFVRNYADMSKEAKALLFGNSGLRQNLDEFVKVIDLVAQSNATRNTSGTAAGLASLAGYSVGGLAGVAMQALTSYGAAKLWTNPEFVRWAAGYAKAAKTGNQAAINAATKRLSVVAASNPALREEIAALTASLNDNTRALVAAQPQQEQDEQAVPQP